MHYSLRVLVANVDHGQGSYVIKLAQASNIHPIITIAGRGQDYVESLISREKGDAIVDYRKGDEAVVSGIQDALKKAGVEEVKYAFDATSEHNSYHNISKVVAKEGSHITLILPGKDYGAIPKNIKHSITLVAFAHDEIKAESDRSKAGIKTGGKDFAFMYFRLFAKGLQEGWFTPHPYEVVPGGLNGVEKGLADLKAGKNSATKYIFEI